MNWIDAHTEDLMKLASQIWKHPEISGKEHFSSHCLADYLEAQGFEITWNIAGLETAFIATYNNGKPILGFLAEYDALPNLGFEASSQCIPLGNAGHGCGHNLLGTACVAAACELKQEMVQNNISGTIRVYGCPSEENAIGKVAMNTAGVFDDLTAAITWHPFDRNRVSYDIWQAQILKNYTFHGISAHASKHPEMGRSALDAAELMNIGVNYLREHVADDVRMHYAYVKADSPANIVPDLVQTHYFVRSGLWARTEDAALRVDNCAKGAALMTGTTVDIEETAHTKETKLNRTLCQLFYKAMTQIPTPKYTEEELNFAYELAKNANLDTDRSGELRLFTGLEPLEDTPVPFSIGTDVSEMSHTVPTVMLSAQTMCKGTPLHHWSTTVQSGMSIGYKGMIYAAKSMALGSKMLLHSSETQAQIWEEHNRK